MMLISTGFWDTGEKIGCCLIIGMYSDFSSSISDTVKIAIITEVLNESIFISLIMILTLCNRQLTI